ncbi:MAG: hypothetical protein ACM3X9_09220 [Bacillota bacterium]
MDLIILRRASGNSGMRMEKQAVTSYNSILENLPQWRQLLKKCRRLRLPK